ncbi:unnamed protein product, partial [Musa banksii]
KVFCFRCWRCNAAPFIRKPRVSLAPLEIDAARFFFLRLRKRFLNKGFLFG